MRQVLLVSISAVLFSLAVPISADAQGVWKQLDDAEKERPQQQMPHGKSLKDICDESKNCRSHYLAKGYVAQWRGVDQSTNHPFDLELLVANEAAVLCVAQPEFPRSDWVICMPMRKVN